MPADLFFHPGHTWVRLDGDDTVTVGISDFAQKLVGPLDRIQLPAVGASLAQGEAALALDADGASVPMLSPVDGTVVAVNPRLGRVVRRRQRLAVRRRLAAEGEEPRGWPAT